MDHISKTNFQAVQQALAMLTTKVEMQEKRVNSYVQSQQILMSTIDTLQKDLMILRANTGSGPTKV
jgi:chaperonin cofactor prefoldin